MNNNLKLFITSLFVTSGLCITSCKDDVKTPDYPEIEENVSDLTKGLNVKIIELGMENSFHIPLGTKRDVEWNITGEYEEEDPFNFRIETGEDQLKTLICDEILEDNLVNEGPHLYKIRLSVKNSDLSKEIHVVLRTSLGNHSVPYAQKYIGSAMNPSEGYQTVKSPVLDFNALSHILNIEDEDTYKLMKFQTGGKRYAEIMETLAKHTGITGDALFLGTLSDTPFGHVRYQCDDVVNYENYLGYRGVTLAQVSIKPDELDEALETGNFIKYLDVTVNDIFNNSNSEEYKLYSNDYDGVKALLDRVGAFVITEAGFGGTYQFKYARKENTYYNHIGIDASTYLDRAIENPGSISSWFNEFSNKIGEGNKKGYIDINKTTQSNYGNDYIGIDKSFSKNLITGVAHEEVSYDATLNIDRNGVNVKDTLFNISSWEETLRKNPSNWTLTNYKRMDKKDKFVEDGLGLIPVYKFISEPNRREAVEKFFKDYLKNTIPERETHHLVVADFFMEKYWDIPDWNDHQTHENSPARYRPSISPLTGDILPRTILVSNMNAPCRHNLSLETNCDHYIVCSTEQYHYWYYVLGYDEDGEGFSDIRFSNKNLTGGWVRRGDHADEGTSGVALDNNYVWIKSDSKVDYKGKVKAVALSMDKDYDEFYGDKILASTTPGQMGKEKPSDSNAFKTTDFFKYWDTSNAHPYDNTHFYEGGAVFYHRFKVVPNWDSSEIEEKGLCWGEDVLGVPNMEPAVNMAPDNE